MLNPTAEPLLIAETATPTIPPTTLPSITETQVVPVPTLGVRYLPKDYVTPIEEALKTALGVGGDNAKFYDANLDGNAPQNQALTVALQDLLMSLKEDTIGVPDLSTLNHPVVILRRGADKNGIEYRYLFPTQFEMSISKELAKSLEESHKAIIFEWGDFGEAPLIEYGKLGGSWPFIVIGKIADGDSAFESASVSDLLTLWGSSDPKIHGSFTISSENLRSLTLVDVSKITTLDMVMNEANVSEIHPSYDPRWKNTIPVLITAADFE
jgi:hypothetical protein